MAAKHNDLWSLCAIVTGAASGIGLEFAKELARRKCNLLLVDINADSLDKARTLILQLTRHEYCPDIHLLTLDLTSDDAVRRLDSFCKGNNILPDILINNAGIFSFRPIAGTSPERIETFIDLHVRTVTLLSRWFVNLRTPYSSGFILNMSSMSCWMPMPGLAMYAATKSYIRVFSRALHYEVRDAGISVTVACPGGIATDLFGLPPRLRKFAVKIGVLYTPERFAAKALDRMLRHKKQYINGFLNRFSIFFVAILPTPVRMLIKRHLLDKGITR